MPDLLRGEIAHEGKPFVDKEKGALEHVVEIVGAEQHRRRFKAQPAHVALDAADIFLVFLDRVGIVVAQVALAAVFNGRAKVEANRFGMPDMQVAVGLGRETRDHMIHTPVGEVIVDDFLNEVSGFRFRHNIVPPPLSAEIHPTPHQIAGSCF